jgi:hypothetical protein
MIYKKLTGFFLLRTVKRSNLLLWTHTCSNTLIQCLSLISYNVVHFVSVSAKFGTCTVVNVNGTLVEAKMCTAQCTVTLECTHFIFNKFPIYTRDSASTKLALVWDETDYSVVLHWSELFRSAFHWLRSFWLLSLPNFLKWIVSRDEYLSSKYFLYESWCFSPFSGENFKYSFCFEITYYSTVILKVLPVTSSEGLFRAACDSKSCFKSRLWFL